MSSGTLVFLELVLVLGVVLIFAGRELRSVWRTEPRRDRRSDPPPPAAPD